MWWLLMLVVVWLVAALAVAFLVAATIRRRDREARP